MTHGVFELLSNWQAAVRVNHKAHIQASARLERRNRQFGMPVVVLSTVTGTTLFATLEATPETWVKILVGIFSVAAAVLSSLQTFFGYNELAERHRSAARKYGALRRELEEVIAEPSAIDRLPDDFVESVRTRWDTIDADSPTLSQRLYQQVAKSVFKSSNPPSKIGE